MELYCFIQALIDKDHTVAVGVDLRHQTPFPLVVWRL